MMNVARQHRVINRRAFMTGLAAVLGALLAAEAQPHTKPLIGFLHQGSLDPPSLTEAFR